MKVREKNNKYRVTYLLLFVFASCSTFGQSIVNSSFEQGRGGDVAQWKISNDANFYFININDRECYLEIKSKKDVNNNAAIAYVYQTESVAIEEAKKFVLSGRIKADSISQGWAGFYITAMDSMGGIRFYDDTEFAFTQDEKWRSYNIDVILDESTKNISTGIIMTGNGQALFDDIQIRDTITIGLPSSEATRYLRDFIDTVKNFSIYRESVDWNDFEQRLTGLLEGAKTPADIYPIIRYGIGLLGDRHGYLSIPTQAEIWQGATGDKHEIPPVEAKYLGNNIGYITVPHFSSGNDSLKTAFADALQRRIADLDDRNGIEGWIVDLRENTGGNMWPMLAGLGPLNSGKIGEFQMAGSDNSWYYKNGKSFLDEEIATELSDSSYTLSCKMPPVALLIGPNTGSSGEAVAISFIGRHDTKTFGLPTAGYTTANDDFVLSDKALLYISTDVMADRNGNAFYDKVYPDVEINYLNDTEGIDSAEEAALTWLRSQNTCNR